MFGLCGGKERNDEIEKLSRKAQKALCGHPSDANVFVSRLEKFQLCNAMLMATMVTELYTC